MKPKIESLEVGDRIKVGHVEDVPYDLLPEGTRFEHQFNAGNPYTGFSSVFEVVVDN